MKLRHLLLLAAGIAIVAYVIFRISQPYLSGNPSGSSSIREFRGGTFRNATETEPTP